MNAFLTKIKTFNLCKQNWLAWIAALAMCGCEQGSFDGVANETLSDSPAVWMVPDGMKVDIGGEIVSIIGTDDCDLGLGTEFRCWKYSLVPGEAQLVSLSNGKRELWQTQSAGEGKIYLVRPDGFKVVGLPIRK